MAEERNQLPYELDLGNRHCVGTGLLGLATLRPANKADRLDTQLDGRAGLTRSPIHLHAALFCRYPVLMFKIAAAHTVSDFDEAKSILLTIYKENPKHWPYGIDPYGFDGGLYLIREKRSSKAVGFCGWQERWEMDKAQPVKTGYYSIGVLPGYRGAGYAKRALSKLISEKSAGVDRVRAMVVSSNTPSLGLAKSLGVPVLVKAAALRGKLLGM